MKIIHTDIWKISTSHRYSTYYLIPTIVFEKGAYMYYIALFWLKGDLSVRYVRKRGRKLLREIFKQ